MERIFHADVAELGSRSGCPKGVLGIPDGDVDVAEIGAGLRALVQLTGPVPGLAQQETMGSFPADQERFVLAAGDLKGIDQDDSLLVHSHNSLIIAIPGSSLCRVLSQGAGEMC